MNTKVTNPEPLTTPEALNERIQRAMLADRARFNRRAKRLKGGAPAQPSWRQLVADVEASVSRCEARVRHPVRVTYPPELPISQSRESLLEALREQQVVVVCGATGSGKTTQLPKLCLELGLGARALIGHTQPRRVAARRVAARIEEELGSDQRGTVGYQVRFNASIEPACRVKVMTDGILLAEVQADRRLQRYEALIIDEAHERSLNIDFLLGYLKPLLRRRPDLKLIISSATIDAEAFSTFFDGAPVIEVSGRLYPVETRYEPAPEGVELVDAAAAAVASLQKEAAGDILVFLPGERHIRELAAGLRGMLVPRSEVLPLYARLPTREQDRVFVSGKADGKRRVVLATNVAETSITVPGIRHVVDTGLARISRYSHRSTVQRLPIEPISQASADQRKGRAGRLGPGICVRLYDEEEFEARPEYTEPEILRSNLAAVLLRLLALGWREVEDFPFLDPPDRRNINDGYRLLSELGALDEEGGLSDIGQRLARLPVDPRVGRMLIEASELSCLREVLIIASGLALADVRERQPQGSSDEHADRAHERFRDTRSDFTAMLRIWRQFRHWARGADEGKLRAQCRRARLSFNRLREWQEVHDQLAEIAGDVGLRTNQHGAGYARIHRALLSGLLRNIGYRSAEREYSGVRDTQFVISPGSFQHGGGHRWVMAGELIETSRLYGFRVASIRPEWIEQCAGPLLRKNHFEAHWDAERAEAMVFEQTSLYGLVVVPRRRVRFAPVSRTDARDLFIRAGLVEGAYASSARFLASNAEVIARLRRFDHKLRRPDVLTSDDDVHAFYDRLLPADVCDGPGFEAWRRGVERQDASSLYLSEADLLGRAEMPDLDADYPDQLAVDGQTMVLRYRFAPKSEDDGVTVRVPVNALRALDPGRFEWLVPGMLEEKVTALLRLLPKAVRRGLVPLPECAQAFLDSLPRRQAGELPAGSLRMRLAEFVLVWRGVQVPLEHWSAGRVQSELDPALRMHFEVVDEDGHRLVQGRDLAELQRRMLAQSPAAKRQARMDTYRDWEFGDLPEFEEVERDGIPTRVYPALVDRRDSVERTVTPVRETALRLTRQGLLRLCALRIRRPVLKHLRTLPCFDEAQLCYLTVPENPLLGNWIYSRDLDEQLGDERAGLQRELVDLVASRLFLEERDEVRTRIAFETRLAAGMPALEGAVKESTELVHQCLREYREVKLLLDNPELRLPHASREDVMDQLRHLFFRGFIVQVPAYALAEYPRYLRGLRRRLEKLSQGGARDADKVARFEPYWRRYLQRLQEHADRGRADNALERFRWMLEEFRISLFAQEVGTAYPVSNQRMERQWAEVSL